MVVLVLCLRLEDHFGGQDDLVAEAGFLLADLLAVGVLGDEVPVLRNRVEDEETLTLACGAVDCVFEWVRWGYTTYGWQRAMC